MGTGTEGAPLVTLEPMDARAWLDALPHAFATLWERAPWVSSDDRFAVELAATEISTNIVRHSPTQASVRVHVELDADANRIRVTLRDTAPPVDIDLSSSMPPEDAESGRGIALAQACLDRLDHRTRSRGAGNRWQLERRNHLA